MSDTLYSVDEMLKRFFQAQGSVTNHLGDESRLTENDLKEQWNFFEFIYKPSETLKSRISEYIDWCESKHGEDAGKLMEEIAFLAFDSFKMEMRIASGQSYNAQHDLIVSSSSLEWIFLNKMLHLPDNAGKFLIEAKNIESKVDDKQFSRLCYLVQNKYPKQCHLGIFFTRNGASGFPEKSDSQQRALSNARATQILFHARTERYVVVLDDTHIRRLIEPGSLPRILEALISDVEDGFGQTLSFDNFDGENWSERKVLPPHLKKYTSDKE